MIVDEFASRFVYFYSGYVLAPHIFAFAAWVQGRPAAALAGLVLWGVVNGVLVAAGYAGLPVVSLALGVAGAAAVVAVSSLMANVDLFRPLRYCGEHSIVIYLAFFLPMAATRVVLIKTGLDHRCRDHLGARDGGGCGRGARAVLGGAWDGAALPVRASGALLAHPEAPARPAGGGITAGPTRALSTAVAIGRPTAHIRAMPAATKSTRAKPAKPATAVMSRPLKAGDHLFLVDGSGYIFRAYHALPPLNRKSDGLQVNAVLGFCNMLWKLLRDMKPEEAPTHLAVVFDKSEHTFRTDFYPDYKAQPLRARRTTSFRNSR